MDDEWEEEEQLVVAELSGIIDSEFLTKGKGKCKLVDVDSEQPMMQVGRYVFAGQYEDALGTCVIFDEHTQSDDEDNPSVELKYKCHTMKKLMMQRTFLTDRKEGESVSDGIEILSLNEGYSNRMSSMICRFKSDNAPRGDSNADGTNVSSNSETEELEVDQSTIAETTLIDD